MGKKAMPQEVTVSSEREMLSGTDIFNYGKFKGLFKE